MFPFETSIPYVLASLPPVITVPSENLKDDLSSASASKGTGSTTSPSNLYRPPPRDGISLIQGFFPPLGFKSNWLKVDDNIDPGSVETLHST